MKFSRLNVIKTITTKRRASPLVEEGILLGLGFLVFLILVSTVTGIFDWFTEMANDLIQTFENI